MEGRPQALLCNLDICVQMRIILLLILKHFMMFSSPIFEERLLIDIKAVDNDDQPHDDDGDGDGDNVDVDDDQPHCNH